jgi:hypothetical protein
MKREYIPGAAHNRAPDKFKNIKATTLKTIEECDEAIEYVTKSLTSIKQQISEAKRGHAAEGIQSDWRWLTNAEAARSAMGHHHQELTRRRAELAREKKQAEHEARQQNEMQVFVQVAREAVGSVTVGAWMAEARRRMLVDSVVSTLSSCPTTPSSSTSTRT